MKIIYYHNDMDGISSAAIVLKVFPEEDIKCVAVDYGNEDVLKIEDIKDNDVFIVDFSFPPETMKLIQKEANALQWIDHHKTAMEKNPELWHSKEVDGIRSLEKSGCELTWEYFFPDNEMPYAIKLIGDYDMWNFKYPSTKKFGELINLFVDFPKHDYWKWLLDTREGNKQAVITKIDDWDSYDNYDN